MGKKKVVRIYGDPAGGWGALKATGKALALQGIAVSGAKTLLHMNQPEGFDRPGCAWSDPKHTPSFEFCDNGEKVVAREAPANRCSPEFFAAHSVSDLTEWDDYDLEMVGRLTHPMACDRALATDGIERIIRSFKVVEYSLPDGCCVAYYPEVNPRVPLYAFDPQSRTRSYKSVPVKVVRATAVSPHSATRAVAQQREEPHHA